MSPEGRVVKQAVADPVGACDKPSLLAEPSPDLSRDDLPPDDTIIWDYGQLLLWTKRLRAASCKNTSELPCDVARAARFVHEHLFDVTLNVNSVKLACGLRNNNISMRFRRAMGLTMRVYIEQRRLAAALALLTQTSARLHLIAATVGYEHHETFVRAFRRVFHCTPSEYRAEAAARWTSRAHGSSSRDEAPAPERVLVTTVCRDAYSDDPNRERPSSITANGFQDGFGEYSTHLPAQFKFSTNQPSYGLSFLEANVPGPTYLQYPLAADLEARLSSGRYDVIAISAYAWSLPWALSVARRAKEKYGFREAWLGSYAVMTDEPLIEETFDRVFWGCSESSFSEAMGRSAISVDHLEHPDLTTEARFAGRHSTIGHVLFRRGCPNRCSYCADPVFQRGGESPFSVEAIDAILDRYREKNIRTIYFSNQDTDLLSRPGALIVDSMYRRG